ncbi:hypothetical protein KUTeg_002847 [Tegillarca granosa]|uniref:Uncharacterized protein n=1 Tax=Tegillarca granosa TaxID=220873 RepID=A0ABQ9FV76_TEGGR|nr:hypothetical protein KUTeg_002847 [Tegillarca granosa]
MPIWPVPLPKPVENLLIPADDKRTQHDSVQLKPTIPVDIPNLPGSNTWFIGNVKQYGYYRVIHDINRAQIINDAWNLANNRSSVCIIRMFSVFVIRMISVCVIRMFSVCVIRMFSI